MHKYITITWWVQFCFSRIYSFGAPGRRGYFSFSQQSLVPWSTLSRSWNSWNSSFHINMSIDAAVALVCLSSHCWKRLFHSRPTGVWLIIQHILTSPGRSSPTIIWLFLHQLGIKKTLPPIRTQAKLMEETLKIRFPL